MAYKGERASVARKVNFQQRVQTVVRSVVMAAKAARRVNARVVKRVGAGRMMPVLSAKMTNFPLGAKTFATNAKTVYTATKIALFVRSVSLASI